MATTRDVQIKIKVTDDGQALVQIDRLGKGFMTAQKAAKQFEDAIKRQDPVLKGSVADYQRQIRALKLVRDNSAKTAKEFARQTKAIEQLQIKQRALATEVTNVNKVNEDQISNAGLAGATLTEFGRTISDLPYGIRGVANNLSQLSTLFITLVSKSDGATNAFKQLITQLRGPLGFILVFQAVISALDFFVQQQQKATAEIKTFANEFGETAAKLRSYQQILNDTNVSESEKADVLREVSEETNGLNLEIGSNNILTDESNRLLDKNITKLKEQAEARALLDRLTELNTDKLKLEFELREALGSKYNRFINLLSTSTQNVTAAGAGLLKAFGVDKVGGIIKRIQLINEESADLLRRISEGDLDIFDFTDTEVEKAKNQLLSFLEKLKMAEEDFEDKTEIDKINRKEERHLAELEKLEIETTQKEELVTRIQEYYRAVRIRQEEQDALKAKKLRDKMMEQRFDDLARLFGEETKFGQASLLLKMNFANIEKAINDGVTWESIKNSLVTGTTSFFEGLSHTASKYPFPLNIPMVAGYIATASPFLLQLKAAVGLFKGKKKGSAPAIPSPGGGGAGGAAAAAASIQAPDFNVVGATAQSQLAETVAGTQSRPLRAFVVGKDITTQQELDRNTRRTASFGG